MLKYIEALGRRMSGRYIILIATVVVIFQIDLLLGVGRNFAYKNITLLLVIALYGAVIAVVGEGVIAITLNQRRLIRAAKQKKHYEVWAKRITTLSQNHPELIEFLEIQRLEREEQEEEQHHANRRAFWQGVAQNFVFFFLGVIIPELLPKFHVFGS